MKNNFYTLIAILVVSIVLYCIFPNFYLPSIAAVALYLPLNILTLVGLSSLLKMYMTEVRNPLYIKRIENASDKLWCDTFITKFLTTVSLYVIYAILPKEVAGLLSFILLMYMIHTIFDFLFVISTIKEAYKSLVEKIRQEKIDEEERNKRLSSQSKKVEQIEDVN